MRLGLGLGIVAEIIMKDDRGDLVRVPRGTPVRQSVARGAKRGAYLRNVWDLPRLLVPTGRDLVARAAMNGQVSDYEL